jgi:4-hydroxybenzoate polyprenyltransferase
MSEPAAPRRSRIGRIGVFFARMFPPWVLVPSAVAHYLAIDLSVRALARQSPALLGWRSACGAASVVLFSLLMRAQDELKDLETDLRLGRAGDPRYVDRPIVTGDVERGDIVIIRWLAFAALLALNAPLGWPAPLAPFLLAFAWVWLSFHWFFVPSMKDRLLLAFATHNPITLAVAAYAAAVAASDAGLGELGAPLGLVLVGLWLPVAAWETSRKVRLPPDETEYTTYSKLLGWRVATLVPLACVAASVACLVLASPALGLARGFGVALAAGALPPVFASLRLLAAPTTARADLRPWFEVYAVVANVGLAGALGLAHGVSVRA